MYYGYHYVNVFGDKHATKRVAGGYYNLNGLNSTDSIIGLSLCRFLLPFLFGLYLGLAFAVVYDVVFAYDLAVKTRGGRGWWWPAY
jgi:hypothetical protein